MSCMAVWNELEYVIPVSLDKITVQINGSLDFFFFFVFEIEIPTISFDRQKKRDQEVVV